MSHLSGSCSEVIISDLTSTDAVLHSEPNKWDWADSVTEGATFSWFRPQRFNHSSDEIRSRPQISIFYFPRLIYFAKCWWWILLCPISIFLPPHFFFNCCLILPFLPHSIFLQFSMNGTQCYWRIWSQPLGTGTQDGTWKEQLSLCLWLTDCSSGARTTVTSPGREHPGRPPHNYSPPSAL